MLPGIDARRHPKSGLGGSKIGPRRPKIGRGQPSFGRARAWSPWLARSGCPDRPKIDSGTPRSSQDRLWGASRSILGRFWSILARFWLKNVVRSTKIEVSTFSASDRSKNDPRASSERSRRPPGCLLSALGSPLGALGSLLGRFWVALGRSWLALERSWVDLGSIEAFVEQPSCASL